MKVMTIQSFVVWFWQEVTFRVDYTVPTINREFGTVFLGGQNVADMVVSAGWAKVHFVPF